MRRIISPTFSQEEHKWDRTKSLSTFIRNDSGAFLYGDNFVITLSKNMKMKQYFTCKQSHAFSANET